VGLWMQPPNEEFFTLFGKAGANVVESAAILMEFAACRTSAGRNSWSSPSSTAAVGGGVGY